ncbi:hypothetical protein E4198_16250 [Streptomyces sp. RKND-216]|uniref:SUKH-4 family immunity protein n=1 Tax=Streptomyces sp. RKND-216 TaxID=2562581 RepID=UPI00109E051C|nr:SUKH-4 family immunity protein [Streptomyces sp. RKND-216]THA27764.1 hypothetical protein E4198_16250 [Streptomyces sp. RKND-216]
MVTFAEAQDRAERWINADVPGYQRRAVQLREFDLGFVVWAEDREDGPTSEGARARLVIARDGGEATLWPGLPVDEVVRRYTEEYGDAGPAPAPVPPQRVDLEATSFLLTPPEWLQETADRMGIPARRRPDDESAPGAAAPAGTSSGTGAGSDRTGAGPATPGGASGAWPAAGSSGGSASPWEAADTSSSGEGFGQEPPATVFAPPLSGSDDEDTAPPAAHGEETPTAFLTERGAPARTTTAPAVEDDRAGAVDEPTATGEHRTGGTSPGPSGTHGRSQGAGTPPPPPVAPPPAPAPGAGLTDFDTDRRPSSPPKSSRGPSVPPPPGPPPAPGTPSGAGSTGGGSTGGYVPTQMVSADDIASQGSDAPEGGSAPDGPADGPGSLHHAATMLAGPLPGGPGAAPTPPSPAAPQPPHTPGTPPPGVPAPHPGPPPHAAAPMPHGTPPPHAGAAPPAYGRPQQPGGAPTVGPGYMAVLRYRAPDGSEQQLIRRSAPGTPHPEWQILHELRAMNVPPQQVLELHTELESCDLPGGYCARMIRETWPQVRVSHTAAYGTDHASRQQGMRHLVEHQGELHQVADAPPRPAPHRVPLPPPHQIQLAPPIPPDAIGHELAQAFGPQGVFRFDQRAVSRHGIPDIVGQVLVWAGVPVDVGPFFWGQAQPGRPVPTLAELAQERGARPAPDAGSYLVMGNDFGRQLCVQYGTAHIVAVPLDAEADGSSATPQFVNTGLPEFIRCLALLGRMWRLRYGLTPEQAGRWTVDFQMQLAMLDPAALSTPENWWSVLLEQMWDGLF